MQVKQKALSIVGVDEAGRGSWAGPVFAAAFVVLSPKVLRAPWWKMLNDSKVLTAKKREYLFECIHEAKTSGWVDFAIGQSSALQIDTFGIKEANRMAMSQALLAIRQN